MQYKKIVLILATFHALNANQTNADTNAGKKELSKNGCFEVLCCIKFII